MPPPGTRIAGAQAKPPQVGHAFASARRRAVTQPTMPATPDDLFATLDRLGITHRTVTHLPLFTVEQSRTLRGQIPGGHTKNLFLRDKKDGLYLVSALEDATIELKSLHRTLGAS